MLSVLRSSWALLFGLFLLMVGNGLQGTLLGVRGALEGFSSSTMAYVMSAYFAGFLLGSRMTPWLIRRVGHVRVFAALASLISAGFILYAAIPHPLSWSVMRFVVGLCFSGVYVVSESWLNASATNETRGQALSAYMITMTVGLIAAQGLLNVGDPADYTQFVIMSVVVSVAVAPILLSVSPAPLYQSTKPMSLRRLYRASPLGVVGTFLLGGIFSGMFGMSAVYATEAGLSTAQISVFVAMIYIGGLVLQFPIGWLSDQMDRRVLILGSTGVAALAILLGLPFLGSFTVLCIVAFVFGGLANPLYALLIAYTNDFLDNDDMAAASGGLIFANGLGAVSGPFVIGWGMRFFGPSAYFVFIATLLAAIAGYAAYRMTRRPAPRVAETGSYAPVMPTASPVAVELSQEYALEQPDEQGEQSGQRPAARAAGGGA